MFKYCVAQNLNNANYFSHDLLTSTDKFHIKVMIFLLFYKRNSLSSLIVH